MTEKITKADVLVLADRLDSAQIALRQREVALDQAKSHRESAAAQVADLTRQLKEAIKRCEG